MWVPEQLANLFSISRDTLERLRKEVAVLKTERDALKLQEAVTRNHFDWLRLRVNVLEVERAQLIQKTYGIAVPVPEIANVGRPKSEGQVILDSSLFEDLG